MLTGRNPGMAPRPLHPRAARLGRRDDAAGARRLLYGSAGRSAERGGPFSVGEGGTADGLWPEGFRDEVGVLAQAVAGAFDVHDDGMVKEFVQQRGRDHGIAEHFVMPPRLTGESLRSGWLMRITRCLGVAFRSAIIDRGAGLD